MAAHVEGTPPALWDPVVRVSHWVIAGVVVANALFTEGGGTLHVWLGWIGMAFLAIRLVWGLIGKAEARFSAFPPRPGAAVRHLLELFRGNPREYRSHNPAGALMVYALWGTLGVVMATGLVMTRAATPWEIARQQNAVASGDWSALVTEGSGESGAKGGDDGEGEWVKEIHEIGGNLLLFLSVIHLGGVLAESVVLRRNLVRPMIAGGRQ